MEIIKKHPIAVDGKIVQKCTRMNNKVAVEVYFQDEHGKKYKNLHDLMNNIPMTKVK